MYDLPDAAVWPDVWEASISLAYLSSHLPSVRVGSAVLKRLSSHSGCCRTCLLPQDQRRTTSGVRGVYEQDCDYNAQWSPPCVASPRSYRRIGLGKLLAQTDHLTVAWLISARIFKVLKPVSRGNPTVSASEPWSKGTENYVTAIGNSGCSTWPGKFMCFAMLYELLLSLPSWPLDL